jgi:regulator of sigma E protease
MKGLPESDLNREFTRQSVWKRIAIVAAGPLANFILAIVVFAGLYINGIPEPTPRLRAVAENTAAHQAGLRGGELVTAINGDPVRIWSDMRWKILQLAVDRKPARIEFQPAGNDGGLKTVELDLSGLNGSDLESDFLAKVGIDLARPDAIIGKILPDGPAKQAGLMEGDRIIRVDGASIRDGLAFVELVRASPGRALDIVALRQGSEVDLRVTPEAVEAKGKTIGRIMAEVPLAPEMLNASYGPLAATAKAAERTWDTSVLTLKMLGKMLVGEVSWKNITGPITIADYAGQTARIGLVSYLSFVAFISISLGVMNLLPIPVLDGGHLLYYALEVLTGKAVPERVGEIAQRAGVGVLMMLMVVAVFNDILRLIT